MNRLIGLSKQLAFQVDADRPSGIQEISSSRYGVWYTLVKPGFAQLRINKP
jgi:hypothetical protein